MDSEHWIQRSFKCIESWKFIFIKCLTSVMLFTCNEWSLIAFIVFWISPHIPTCWFFIEVYSPFLTMFEYVVWNWVLVWILYYQFASRTLITYLWICAKIKYIDMTILYQRWLSSCRSNANGTSRIICKRGNYFDINLILWKKSNF